MLLVPPPFLDPAEAPCEGSGATSDTTQTHRRQSVSTGYIHAHTQTMCTIEWICPIPDFSMHTCTSEKKEKKKTERLRDLGVYGLYYSHLASSP